MGSTGSVLNNPKAIESYLNNHLGNNETYAKVDTITEEKDGVVGVQYTVSVAVPYEETDSDGYAQTYYDYAQEYKTRIINVNELKSYGYKRRR